MRQVNEAELIWRLKYQIRRLSPSLRAGLASRVPDVRREAEQRVALHLAREGLGRLEILSDAPLPEGDDLFSRAAYGEGTITIDPQDEDAR